MKKIFFGKYKRLLIYVVIVLFLLLLPALYNLVPLNGAPRTFYIFSSKIEGVTKSLKENGYTVTWIDRLMLQMDHVPTEGWYSVDPDASGRFDFFKHLYEKKTETMDVVVYAGETAEELTARLANDMKLDKQKLLDYYRKNALFKEADIFAGRYTIARNADEAVTMSYLIDVSRKELAFYVVKYFKEKPEIPELKVLLTIASIIQKESNSVKEMPRISSVIYNRLEKNMKLQMDSTLNYGQYSHTIVTPERIKNDATSYNTYKYKGLPLHPLCTVSLDALYAAKYPQESDYLFFMLRPKGGHVFAATYAKHLSNLKVFRKYQQMKQKEKEEKEKQLQEVLSMKISDASADKNDSALEKRVSSD